MNSNEIISEKEERFDLDLRRSNLDLRSVTKNIASSSRLAKQEFDNLLSAKRGNFERDLKNLGK